MNNKRVFLLLSIREKQFLSPLAILRCKGGKKTMQAVSLHRWNDISEDLFSEFCTHLCTARAFGRKNVLSVVYSLEA